MLQSEDQLYFIHVPKTAGTTLISLLDARFAADEIFPAQLWDDLVKLPQETIRRYRLFRGHFGGSGLEPFLTKPPAKITMLREPLALSQSRFKFIQRNPKTRMNGFVTANRMTFADFIRHHDTRDMVSNQQVAQLRFALTFEAGEGPILANAIPEEVFRWVRQHEKLLPPDEQLDKAIQQLERCAFFGLVERFAESMALLNYTFNWPPAGSVQPLMVAPNEQRSALDEPSQQLLRQLNANDQELYVFAQQRFDARVKSMERDLLSLATPHEHVNDSLANHPELLERLLDRRLARLAQANPPPRRDSIRIDFRQALPGRGWHQRERAPADDSTFRWTGPATASILDLPLAADEDLELLFHVLHAPAADIADSLRVTVNNQPIQLKIVGSRTTLVRRYRGKIPRHILDERSPFTRIAWHVNRTCSLHSADPTNPDRRDVGVAVNWISIVPWSRRDLATTIEGGRGRRWRALLNLPVIGPRARSLYHRLRQRYRSIALSNESSGAKEVQPRINTDRHG